MVVIHATIKTCIATIKTIWDVSWGLTVILGYTKPVSQWWISRKLISDIRFVAKVSPWLGAKLAWCVACMRCHRHHYSWHFRMQKVAISYGRTRTQSPETFLQIWLIAWRYKWYSSSYSTIGFIVFQSHTLNHTTNLVPLRLQEILQPDVMPDIVKGQIPSVHVLMNL